MKKKIRSPKINTNIVSIIVLGLFILLVIFGVVLKPKEAPVKESTEIDTGYSFYHLSPIKAERTSNYLYIYLRDPLYASRDLSKVKLYPYKNSDEMGEIYASRRELKVFRIPVEKGFFSVKLDYDDTVFYFNEKDYQEISKKDLSVEETILVFIENDLMELPTYKQDALDYINEIDNNIRILEDRIINLRNDLLFSSDTEKNRVNSAITNLESDIETAKADREVYEIAINMVEEKENVLIQDREYIISGNMPALSNPSETEELSDTGNFKNKRNFRLAFTHLNENKEVVFDKYYNLDTAENFLDAKFYKTDLEGKFYVDFYNFVDDYLFIKHVKRFEEEENVDSTLRVLYVNDKEGMFETSNLDMLSKTNIELTCKDQDENILSSKKVYISPNKNLDDFLEYTTNGQGVVKFQGITTNDNGIYYISLEGASNVIEIHSEPASLILENATFTIPPPKPKEEPKKEEPKIEETDEKEEDKEP